MKRTAARCGVAATAVLGLAVLLGGCGSGVASESDAPSSVAPSGSTSAGTAAQSASDLPFGTGCGGIPAAGEGSFGGMADDPVATAVGNVPALGTLAAAIRDAHLAEPLNSQPEVTVLAPVNAAFEAVPRETLDPLLNDTAALTALLTHHVIQGRLSPERLPGTHTTLNNDQVTVDVSPEAFSVAAEGTLLGGTPAVVVCGNVHTSNATIYLIDQVLTPPPA